MVTQSQCNDFTASCSAMTARSQCGSSSAACAVNFAAAPTQPGFADFNSTTCARCLCDGRSLIPDLPCLLDPLVVIISNTSTTSVVTSTSTASTTTLAMVGGNGTTVVYNTTPESSVSPVLIAIVASLGTALVAVLLVFWYRRYSKKEISPAHNDAPKYVVLEENLNSAPTLVIPPRVHENSLTNDVPLDKTHSPISPNLNVPFPPFFQNENTMENDHYQWAIQWHNWQNQQREWQLQQRLYYEAKEAERKKQSLLNPEPDVFVPVKKEKLYRPSPLRNRLDDETSSIVSKERASILSTKESIASFMNSKRHQSMKSNHSRNSSGSFSVQSQGVLIATSPKWAAPEGVAVLPDSNPKDLSTEMESGLESSSFKFNLNDFEVSVLTLKSKQNGSISFTQMVSSKTSVYSERVFGDLEADQMVYVVQNDYVGTNSSDLSLVTGDEVVVWKIFENGMCEGYNVVTKKSGYFHLQCMLQK